jgi:hypothetical protein
MALKISTNYQMFDDRTGKHYCIQVVDYDGTSTTVNIPEGAMDGVVLCSTASVTKPSVSVSAANALATLAAGGDVETYVLVTLHVGNAAGL